MAIEVHSSVTSTWLASAPSKREGWLQGKQVDEAGDSEATCPSHNVWLHVTRQSELCERDVSVAIVVNQPVFGDGANERVERKLLQPCTRN
jgi:hypothetical protein